MKVNDFNKWSKVPWEQWIYFLNTGEIPDDANAPGLPEAREKLKLASMSKAEPTAYYKHLDNVVILCDNIVTARGEGRLEGIAEERAEGIAIGEDKKAQEIARNLKKCGVDTATIMQATGLAADEIEALS